MASTSNNVLVVGTGVLGLKVTLELLRKNIKVFLRSSNHPLHPSTCSVGAGGLWMPYKCNDPRIDKWAIETLNELLRDISTNPNNNIDSRTPIEIVPTIYLTNSNDNKKTESGGSNTKANTTTNTTTTEDFPQWTKDERLHFQHLTIDELWKQNRDKLRLRIPSQEELYDAEFTHAWLFHPPVVDPPQMLKKMLHEIQSHPLMQNDESSIKMDRTFTSMEDIVNEANILQCNDVINCTGLGSANLCKDSTLFEGRGSLLYYPRSCTRRYSFTSSETSALIHDACILTEQGTWATKTQPAYIIPRGDKLVVGGSYTEKDSSLSIQDEESSRLKQNAWRLGIDTDSSDEIEQWVGLRPCRNTVCLENDKIGNTRIVHCYGVGGSGWTVFGGIARDAVHLLRSMYSSPN